MLNVNGTADIANTVGILTYVAKEFKKAGYFPKDPVHLGQAVGVAASVEDRFTVLVRWLFTPDDAKAGVAEKEKPEVAAFLAALDKLLQANGGWLVGGAHSFADIIAFDYISQAVPFGTVEIKDATPALKEWYAKVAAIPGIAAYQATQKK